MDNQLRQGPGTFALDTSGSSPVAPMAVPQLGTAPTANPGQIAPGLSTQAPSVSDADSKTFRALTDLASGVLAPKIKEAAQEQFVQGVQQAMTGQGLQDIIKEKPWYSDIFAPSSALAGARTYTAQKAVADWGAQMQTQMPQLAKADPDQLQKAATGALQGFMTGDPDTDAMMTSAVVEQMAPLFKQHAKEHYVYLQKQATMAQVGAWESLGTVYQGFAAAAASGKGTVSPEDLDAAKSRFLGAVTPFADQSDEAFARNISAFLEGSASQGNFHVVKLFKDTGLYDKLPPDQRADLDRTTERFAREGISKAMPQFAVDVATLVNDTTQDPRAIPEKVAALNAKAAAVTGITQADLIPPQYLDNIVGRVMVAQRNELDARARAAAAAGKKDADKAAEVALAAGQINQGPGAVDACEKVGLCKGDSIETAGALAYAGAKNPQDQATVLNSRTLAPYGTVKAQFAATLRSPEFQAGVGNMAQVYKGLADNVKPHYFDEGERATMDRFNSLVSGGMPPDSAWVVAKNAPALEHDMLPSSPKDEQSKAIRAEVESRNENFFHINNVDDAGLRILEAATNRAYQADRGNNPPDVAAKRAYSQALANGIDIQGKHVILNVNPKDRPLFSLVGEAPEATAHAFEDLMAQRAKEQGASLDSYEAYRVPDRNGKAYIYVRATNKDGREVVWHINSDEIKGQAQDTVSKQMQKPAPGTGPVVPPAETPGGASFVYPHP